MQKKLMSNSVANFILFMSTYLNDEQVRTKSSITLLKPFWNGPYWAFFFIFSLFRYTTVDRK